MYLLDTDVLSALRRRNRNAALEAWIAGRADGELHLSVVTIGEIERGIALKRRREPEFASALAQWLDSVLAVYGERILPFGLEAARRWGEISAIAGHDGADLQIAATALERGLCVVTGNVRHYKPTGVATFDPFGRA